MKIPALLTTTLMLAAAGTLSAASKKQPEVPLTARGKELHEQYAKQLETLRAEVASAVPAIDAEKKARFMELRAKWDAIPAIDDDTNPNDVKAIGEQTEQLQAELLSAGESLVTDLKPLLSSEALDPKLMRIAILSDGTPRGFAEFAQQGPEKEKLIGQLFADEPLMRQVLEAGGANGGDYGDMMQVYNAILGKSERARERGTIFQRLALGTAIHMPWQGGMPESGVHGIVQRTQYDVDQVERYLHYEKAFLEGELDPAFPDMNTWECRFITDSEYSNEDLTWVRRMLRNYRPDHITMKDYKWRYVRFIKSDVPYCSTKHDPTLGSKAQEEVALGGICGRRAFLGRLTTRAFGIPTRASTQTAHAAMSHWTPDGWVICLGAWWNIAYCGPQGGLDFLLESQAREFEDYGLVRRAQWLGNAFNEEDVSIKHRQYGQGGGFWDGLAFVKKQIIVKKAEVEALELVGGMKLGESDELLGDEVGEDITIPAVACYSPRKSSDRILFLKSWDKGYQLHYSRLGQRPELFKYRIEVPADGEYELTALAATVSPNLDILVRVNRDEPVPFTMPYTKGSWESSDPVKLKLTEGSNVISISARTPNRGVSIKNWQLKPVK
jgi:hypothetical protein